MDLLTRLQITARGMLGRPPPGQPRGTMRRFLIELARAVATTEARELSCDECMEELDRLVELEAAGSSTDELMPLVKAHLLRCGDCYQDYEGLLRILR